MYELIEFLALPLRFVELMRTSDGHFLAREYGDSGFNHFLGSPRIAAGIGEDYRRRVWHGFDFGQRRRVVLTARHFGLDVRGMLGDQDTRERAV